MQNSSASQPSMTRVRDVRPTLLHSKLAGDALRDDAWGSVGPKPEERNINGVAEFLEGACVSRNELPQAVLGPVMEDSPARPDALHSSVDVCLDNDHDVARRQEGQGMRHSPRPPPRRLCEAKGAEGSLFQNHVNTAQPLQKEIAAREIDHPTERWARPLPKGAAGDLDRKRWLEDERQRSL